MLSDQLTFLAPEGTRDRLDELARKENRNLGSMLRHIVLQHLDEIENTEETTPYGNPAWFGRKQD